MKLWAVELSTYRGIVPWATHTLARYEAEDGSGLEIEIHREITTPEALAGRKKIGLSADIDLDDLDRSSNQFPSDDAAIKTAVKCFGAIADPEKDILIVHGDYLNPGQPLVCADRSIEEKLMALHEEREAAYQARRDSPRDLWDRWQSLMAEIGVDHRAERLEWNQKMGGRVVLHFDGTVERDEDW